MIVPSLLAASSVTVAFFFSQLRKGTVGLALSFLLVFLFLALRYDYGNDYISYLTIFEEISGAAISDYDPTEGDREIGWFILNRLFSGLGFFSMVAALAIFNCYVYFRFIRKYVPTKYYWFAVFLYVVFPDNMLIQLSAMRQAVAISLFLLGIEFIINRKAIYFLACVALASLFHTTALVLLPAYFLGGKRIIFGKGVVLILVATYVSMLLLYTYLTPLVTWVMGLFGDRYQVYEDQGVIGTGLGFVFFGVYLALLLFYHDRQRHANQVLFRIAMVSVYLLPFSISFLMLARVGYYFSVVSIAAIPIIASQINSLPLRGIFIAAWVSFAIYSYLNFFSSLIWKDAYAEYEVFFLF